HVLALRAASMPTCGGGDGNSESSSTVCYPPCRQPSPREQLAAPCRWISILTASLEGHDRNHRNHEAQPRPLEFGRESPSLDTRGAWLATAVSSPACEWPLRRGSSGWPEVCSSGRPRAQTLIDARRFRADHCGFERCTVPVSSGRRQGNEDP